MLIFKLHIQLCVVLVIWVVLGAVWGGGGVVQLSQAAESEGRQNKYFKMTKLIFSIM
jgi:hypothetical protein